MAAIMTSFMGNGNGHVDGLKKGACSQPEVWFLNPSYRPLKGPQKNILNLRTAAPQLPLSSIGKGPDPETLYLKLPILNSLNPKPQIPKPLNP